VAGLSAERRGFPVSIMAGSPDLQAEIEQAPRVTNIVTYEWFSEGEVEQDDEKGEDKGKLPAPATR
jgi:hypothetical protein